VFGGIWEWIYLGECAGAVVIVRVMRDNPDK